MNAVSASMMGCAKLAIGYSSKEDEMAINQALLPEFDQEMANTRKTLERVPDDKFGWRPHRKSGAMGWLAGHVANIPSWATVTIQTDSLDLMTGTPPKPPESRKELLAMFDSNVAAARAAISGASDDHLMKPWTLRSGERVILTLPRVGI